MNYIDTILSKLGLNADTVDELAGLAKEHWLRITAAALAGGTVLYLGKIWWSYRYFKRMGIVTPKIRFISGNYHDIIKNVK